MYNTAFVINKMSVKRPDGVRVVKEAQEDDNIAGLPILKEHITDW